MAHPPCVSCLASVAQKLGIAAVRHATPPTIANITKNDNHPWTICQSPRDLVPMIPLAEWSRASTISTEYVALHRHHRRILPRAYACIGMGTCVDLPPPCDGPPCLLKRGAETPSRVIAGKGGTAPAAAERQRGHEGSWANPRTLAGSPNRATAVRTAVLCP
jgi:hypothetical protein